MTRRVVLGISFVMLCSMTGCSSPKTNFKAPLPVSGTVNLDGQPMPDGTITFIGDGGATEMLPVKEGKFSGPITPGKKRVEIRAMRQGKPTKMGDTIIEGGPENFLPAMYNSDSKITAEVSGSGITPSTFDTKSK